MIKHYQVTFECDDCGYNLLIEGEPDEIAMEIAESDGWNVEFGPELCPKCHKQAKDNDDERLDIW